MTRVESSLNGTWRLALDPDDVGREGRWFLGGGSPESIEVTVPSVWDLWVPDYDGVGWYFREFGLDEDWLGRTTRIEFDAVDYYAEVWLNGTRLGDHEGGYTPFSFDISKVLAIGGPNRLAVRVVDPHGPQGYREFRPKEIPCSKEEGYFSFAGIWGAVRLIGLPEEHIEDVFLQPDIRRKRLTVVTAATGQHAIRLKIAGTSFETIGDVGTLVVEFPDCELWSPETPALYTLECALLQGDREVDHTSVRFGMREFTVKENRFCLNNRPVFIRGVLHQPDYARTLAAPESEAFARRELELARKAGFNLIRLHIKTPPRITLDLADEIGLLVYEEPPIGWIRRSDWMQARCEREVREMVLRDRNHPSIVIWGILNESGNAGYEVNGGAQVIKDDLCRLARSLDPTRLIIDDSGGINTTREPARYLRPYHDRFEEYDDLHIYQRAPVDRDIVQYLLNSGSPARMCFISEFGFGGMENFEKTLAQYGDGAGRLKDARFIGKMAGLSQQGFSDRTLERVFGGFGEFAEAAQELQCDAVRGQIDALRSNSNLAGYCYTQLCDAGHEFCAGVLDRWRRPKPVLDALAEVQKPLRPVIHADQTNLVPRQEVAVTVTIINEHRADTRADLSLQVIGPTNQVLWKKKRTVRVPRTGREIWAGTVSASGSAGRHRFVVRLMAGMKILGESSVDFHVFPKAEPAIVATHVVDPLGEWRRRCGELARPGALDAPIHLVPPLANTIRAYPAEELGTVLERVHGGAVAIVFGPPDDWNDLATHVSDSARATSKDAVGAFLGAYHYIKLHPVFEGLPDRTLMRQPYQNIVPAKTFAEPSDEDICGTFDTAPIATGNYMLGETSWWGSDILVRRFGAGRLVFTHLRVLENLGEDPAARLLFVNLLKHFAIRSMPSEEVSAVASKAVEWLRREGAETVRLWLTAGMFPNANLEGHDTAYPPEAGVDPKAVYPGWYRPVTWRRWHTRAIDGHVLNLQDAFTPVYEYYPRFDYGTGYAYAEFHSDKRQQALLHIEIQDAVKVWLNSGLVFEDNHHRPHRVLEPFRVKVMLRQGRNTILVKVSKVPGEFQFSADFLTAEPAPVPLKLRWWR